ncbi:MAG: hypothetical protein LBD35_03520 [Prevotellaceae bacterium]|jgi:hypothetical protein|nr:hypothetical protein [Prevotellaceae bacterium]
MTNIFNTIEPVDKTLFGKQPEKSKYLFVNGIDFVEKKLPETKIALLGAGTSLNPVREHLYSMYFPYNITIGDLGDLPAKKKDKLPEILRSLMDNGVFTIVAGNSSDTFGRCFESLAQTGSKVSLSCLTPAITQNDFTDYLLNAKRESLSDLTLMAYQTYLSDPEILTALESNYFETLRLGKFREDPKVYEPPLRDSEMLHMDFASLKASEVQSCSESGVNGLYSEEMCTIARYAGLSDKMKLVNIFSRKNLKENKRTNELIAQIVWHIAEGCVHRVKEDTLNNVNGIKKIIVNIETPPTQLIFYHSNRTNRWWIEVKERGADSPPVIVACTEYDYKTACKHEIPLKWIWYRQKLSS